MSRRKHSQCKVEKVWELKCKWFLQELIAANSQPTWSPLIVKRVQMLVKTALPSKKHTPVVNSMFSRGITWCEPCLTQKSSPKIYDQELLIWSMILERVTKVSLLDVHKSSVRQTIYKRKKFSTVAPLPQCGRPVKMTVRAQRRMLSVVKKNPRVSAKNRNLWRVVILL